jgi:hypothetical protein
MTSACIQCAFSSDSWEVPSIQEIGRNPSVNSATPTVRELRERRQTRLAHSMTSLVAKLAYVAKLDDVYGSRRAAIQSAIQAESGTDE